MCNRLQIICTLHTTLHTSTQYIYTDANAHIPHMCTHIHLCAHYTHAHITNMPLWNAVSMLRWKRVEVLRHGSSFYFWLFFMKWVILDAHHDSTSNVCCSTVTCLAGRYACLQPIPMPTCIWMQAILSIVVHIGLSGWHLDQWTER